MKSLRWVIQSDLAAARRIEPQVLAELNRCAFSEDTIFAIRLALEEALVNAVTHGNRRDPSKTVQVEVGIDGHKAVIRVRDQGRGFDRSQVPDPTLPENLEKPSGRGIMLMEAFMTKVCWNKRGNCVEMVKVNE